MQLLVVVVHGKWQEHEEVYNVKDYTGTSYQ
uniref:Uncharacterized protein n=1 Tax=Arundo donax TaxID=35708 RepID=A0A0A9BU31_ARUDO